MPLDLNELRQRIINGGSYTREELKEAISILRVSRTEAAVKTTKARKSAAPTTDLDLDDSLRQAGLNF